jgi:cell division protein FtsN
MARTKQQTGSSGRKSRNVDNRKAFARRLGFFLFVSIWMFGLGVFVGRQTVPMPAGDSVRVDELAGNRPDEKRSASNTVEADSPALEFHEALKKPKEEVDIPVERAAAKPIARPELSARPQPAPVEPVQTPPVAAAPEKADTEAAAAGADRYTIQIASVDDAAVAGKMVRDLIADGYPAYRVVKDPNARDTVHRVRVGRYAGYAVAVETRDRLKSKYHDAFITKVPPEESR